MSAIEEDVNKSLVHLRSTAGVLIPFLMAPTLTISSKLDLLNIGLLILI